MTRARTRPQRADAASGFPWGDLRLWAGMGLAAGLAAVANLAWAAAIPGRAPATPWVAACAAAVALASLAPLLHPRLAPWSVRGGRSVPLPSVALSLLLAPPRPGPAFWTFLWTLALLLWLWLVSDRIAVLVAPRPGASPGGGGRRTRFFGRTAGARAAGVLLGPLTTLALWVAVCDLALRRTAPGWAAGRLWGAAAAAAACLLLASGWARGELVRQARADGAAVAPGFAGQWWWAAVPAVSACVLLAALWPRYPAPLQGGGLQRLVLAYVARLGKPGAVLPGSGSGGGGSGAGGGSALLLAVFGLAALIAWPGRGLVQRSLRRVRRRPARPQPPTERAPVRVRLAAWWDRLRGWLGLRVPRRVRLQHGVWRPLSAAPPPARRAFDPPFAPAPAGTARGRVRAAYSHFLRQAAAAGLRRAEADTPRRFLQRLIRRAPPARFPLASLTDTYEEARFSVHAVADDAAARAEADARAALYGVRLAQRAHDPSGEEAQRWTAPRGVSRRRGRVE